MAKLKLEIELPVSILREGKKFIAYTPALDLSTCGRSYEEVKRRFNEIVGIFFEELIKKGTLEDVLQELGWERKRSQWSPPMIISQESQAIQVPVPA